MGGLGSGRKSTAAAKCPNGDHAGSLVVGDEASGPDDVSREADDPPAGEIVTGPHAWINWYAERDGHPRRTERHPEAFVVRPIWEEFALYSDCDLHGHLATGPYEVFSIDHGPARIGAARKRLLLRMWDHLPDGPPQYDLEPRTDVDVYFGGDIGDELAALLGLALGRRIRSGGSVRQGLPLADVGPLGYPNEAYHTEPSLEVPRRGPMLPTIARSTSIGDAADLVGTYPTMSASDAVALLRAARQYVDGLWLADADPRLAWLKLVAALEAAACKYDDASHATRVDQLKHHMPELAQRLESLPAETVAAIAKDFAGTFKVRQKLRTFVEDFDPGPPTDRPQDTGWQFNWSTLDRALSVIYTHRSNDVHAGIAFPLPMCVPPYEPDDGPAAERFTGSLGGQGGRWSPDKLPMCLHVFAHVVGGALRKWWMSLAATTGGPSGAPIRARDRK